MNVNLPSCPLHSQKILSILKNNLSFDTRLTTQQLLRSISYFTTVNIENGDKKKSFSNTHTSSI